MHPSPPVWEALMSEAYYGQQVVGMDLRRRRSMLVRMTGDGRKLETTRITNSPAELRRVIARAGKRPKVVGVSGTSAETAGEHDLAVHHRCRKRQSCRGPMSS